MAMAKVYGMHNVELKPGVDGQEFERFVAQELNAILGQVPGQSLYFLKGDRGVHAGHYLLVFEIETVKRRDALYPLTDEGSEEANKFFADNNAVMEKLDRFIVSLPDPEFTDYVVIE
jgi:hypothetical protein